MRRSGLAFPFVFALLSTAVIACGGGGMGDDDDDDDDDDCTGVSNCSVQGSTCDGDTVVDCQPDMNGCLVETTVDCAASGEACDDTGGDAMCVDVGCDDPECAGASDGDVICDSDAVVSCDADMDGCLIATIDEDCAANGDACDDSTDPPMCVCADDTECDGAADGDTLCSGDTLVTCTEEADGCLDATLEDCTTAGGTCDDSGDPAVCTTECTDDPACAGMNDGDTFCNGAFLNTCTAGGDGCLDLTQENCSPALCDDTTPPAACGTVAQLGDTCADAIPVLSSSFVYSGADFTADFTDTETFGDASCNDGNGGAHQDAFFTIDLLDGQTLVIAELGGLDTVRNIQTTCGGANSCVAAQDDPDDDFRYTASADETVFIAVEPYSDAPGSTDYELHISIDPVCGNGYVEAGEQCDDANTDPGDGCSATCTIEFTYECDGLSPTTCEPYPDLGTYAAGDTFDDLVVNDTVSDTYVYQITFTTPIDLSGTLSANNMGDPDFYLIDDVDGAIVTGAVDGDEAFAGVVPADTYLLVIDPYVELDTGYTLAMTLGGVPTIGDGDNVTETGGPLATDESDWYEFTIEEPVEIVGTLTGTDGDLDLIIYTLGDDLVTYSAAVGDETFNIALQAGTYKFEVNAYAQAATDYTLDFDATTLAVPDIGTFAAGDTIGDTTGGPLTPPTYAHYTVTFTDDVQLSGSVGGFTTGDPDLLVYNASGVTVFSAVDGAETFSDIEVAAGNYIVQVIPYGPAGEIDSYTLSLSTTAVP